MDTTRDPEYTNDKSCVIKSIKTKDFHRNEDGGIQRVHEDYMNLEPFLSHVSHAQNSVDQMDE